MKRSILTLLTALMCALAFSQDAVQYDRNALNRVYNRFTGTWDFINKSTASSYTIKVLSAADSNYTITEDDYYIVRDSVLSLDGNSDSLIITNAVEIEGKMLYLIPVTSKEEWSIYSGSENIYFPDDDNPLSPHLYAEISRPTIIIYLNGKWVMIY